MSGRGNALALSHRLAKNQTYLMRERREAREGGQFGRRKGRYSKGPAMEAIPPRHTGLVFRSGGTDEEKTEAVRRLWRKG